MKKINKFLKPASLAMLLVAVSMSTAFAAGTPTPDVKGLAKQIQPVFKVIRNLAFIGVGFILLEEAWKTIKEGKNEWDKLGIKLLWISIGVIILFSVDKILDAWMGGAGGMSGAFAG